MKSEQDAAPSRTEAPPALMGGATVPVDLLGPALAEFPDPSQRAAIAQVIDGKGALTGGVQVVNMAIFQILGQLPLSAVTSLLVILLLVIFTVTSVDSGALVADNLASNGRTDTPRPQRVLWVFLIGLVATTLLVLGGDDGLKGLQSATIVMALPYLALMAVLITGFIKALLQDHRR